MIIKNEGEIDRNAGSEICKEMSLIFDISKSLRFSWEMKGYLFSNKQLFWYCQQEAAFRHGRVIWVDSSLKLDVWKWL